jgi:phospholipid/cholesterol/gamma-HCH transport system substrate-binding protein
MSAERFSIVAEQIDRMVAENRGPLRDFSAEGLFEFTAFLTEARALISGLNRVTSEVERDPARFLFGNQQQGYETVQ